MSSAKSMTRRRCTFRLLAIKHDARCVAMDAAIWAELTQISPAQKASANPAHTSLASKTYKVQLLISGETDQLKDGSTCYALCAGPLVRLGLNGRARPSRLWLLWLVVINTKFVTPKQFIASREAVSIDSTNYTNIYLFLLTGNPCCLMEFKLGKLLK